MGKKVRTCEDANVLLLLAVGSLHDDPACVFAEPRSAKSRVGGFCVGVAIGGQQTPRDVVLNKVQRTTTGSVVGVRAEDLSIRKSEEKKCIYLSLSMLRGGSHGWVIASGIGLGISIGEWC